MIIGASFLGGGGVRNQIPAVNETTSDWMRRPVQAAHVPPSFWNSANQKKKQTKKQRKKRKFKKDNKKNDRKKGYAISSAEYKWKITRMNPFFLQKKLGKTR